MCLKRKQSFPKANLYISLQMGAVGYVSRLEKLVSDCDKGPLVVANLEFGVKCCRAPFKGIKMICWKKQ